MTTRGCSTAAAARASRRNRSLASGVAATSGRISLMATVRRSAGSSAESTTPMPPPRARRECGIRRGGPDRPRRSGGAKIDFEELGIVDLLARTSRVVSVSSAAATESKPFGNRPRSFLPLRQIREVGISAAKVGLARLLSARSRPEIRGPRATPHGRRLTQEFGKSPRSTRQRWLARRLASDNRAQSATSSGSTHSRLSPHCDRYSSMRGRSPRSSASSKRSHTSSTAAETS